MVTWKLEALRARPALLAHGLLSAAFLLERWLLDLGGMRMNFRLDWMFLADPADLRDRLLYTAIYAHSFPPGMNLLGGWMLKLGPDAAVYGVHICETTIRTPATARRRPGCGRR
jgi:hypothetical protein